MNQAKYKGAEALLAKAARTLEAAKNSFAHDFFDDASSRAYYAAFHAMSAALGDRDLFFTSHGQVLGAFNKELVKTGICVSEAFQKIRQLFEHRQIGDYSATISIDRSTAMQDLLDAEWLVEECRRLIDKG